MGFNKHKLIISIHYLKKKNIQIVTRKNLISNDAASFNLPNLRVALFHGYQLYEYGNKHPNKNEIK